MGAIQPWHIIVVAVVFLALFGYKKLPDATRSIGRSMRIFKSEMKGLTDDEGTPAKPEAQTSTVLPPPVIESHAATDAAAAAPGSTATQSTVAPHGATVNGANVPRPESVKQS